MQYRDTHPLPVKRLLFHKHTLLLQGPIGPFFGHLADFLELNGQVVSKINFNGGDRYYYGNRASDDFTGTPAAFRSYLNDYLDARTVDSIVLFGEWRLHHQIAWVVAHERNIDVYVFEEGYLRPHYVTLEPQGVNAYSSIPRDANYLKSAPIFSDSPTPLNVAFNRVMWRCIRYYMAAWALRVRFRRYIHHRSMNAIAEGARWILSGFRKHWYRLVDRKTLERITHCDGGYFLVPLQVQNDSQLRFHSDFARAEVFIEEVVKSFSLHAPADKLIVFKHHPMDRAYSNYTRFFKKIAVKYGLVGRVLYIHDGWLPGLLSKSCGVVTINSTVGFSALGHLTPVKTLGDAFYNVGGLVSSESLDEFWTNPGEVDKELFNRLKSVVLQQTQLNMSFYEPSTYELAFPLTLRPQPQPQPQPQPRLRVVSSNSSQDGDDFIVPTILPSTRESYRNRYDKKTQVINLERRLRR